MVQFSQIVNSDTIGSLKSKINGNFLKIQFLQADSDTSTPTLKMDFNDNITWTINHNQNTFKVQSTVYDFTGKEIIPNEVYLLNANTLEIRFIVPQAGYAIISF